MARPVLGLLLLVLWSATSEQAAAQVYPETYRFHPGGVSAADTSDWLERPLGSFPADAWTGRGVFRFELRPDTSGGPLGLVLRQRGAATWHLDGRLVHQAGQLPDEGVREKTDFRSHLVVVHRPDTLRPMVLTAELSSAYLASSGWSGAYPSLGFTVGAPDELAAGQQRFTRLVTFHQMLIMGLALAFAIVHGLLFAFHSEPRANLHYAALALAAAVTVFFSFEGQQPRDAAHVLWSARIYGSAFVLFALACLRLTYTFTYPEPPRWYRLFVGAALVLVGWSLVQPFAASTARNVFTAVLVLEIARALVMSFVRPRETMPDGGAIVGMGAVPIVLVGGYVTLADLGIVSIFWDFLVFPAPYYALLVLMGAMSIYLARHVAATSRDLQRQLRRVRRLSDAALAQERKAREEAVLRAQLEAENERKSRELEEARQLQLSMLPVTLPQPTGLRLAAHLETATEVGGDYYDARLRPDGTLTLAVGDATGHGLQAGTMVTATKSLFNALGDDAEPVTFLRASSEALKEMGFRRVYMALTLARFSGHAVQIASAGMPFPLLWRAASGSVEEVALRGMPLGSFPNFPYQTATYTLEPGDLLLFMSDGFPERFNPERHEFGYDRAREAFAEAACAGGGAEAVIQRLRAAGEAWAAGEPPNDDVTFVVAEAC